MKKRKQMRARRRRIAFGLRMLCAMFFTIAISIQELSQIVTCAGCAVLAVITYKAAEIVENKKGAHRGANTVDASAKGILTKNSIAEISSDVKAAVLQSKIRPNERKAEV